MLPATVHSVNRMVPPLVEACNELERVGPRHAQPLQHYQPVGSNRHHPPATVARVMTSS